MQNISDILTVGARRAPESIALVSRGVSVSFSALDALVWRAATLLVATGVSRGDVIAISFRSEMTSFVVLMALARIGASTLALSLGDTPTMRAATVRSCGAKRLLTDDPQVDEAGLQLQVIEARAFAAKSAPIDQSVRDPAPQSPWIIAFGSGSTGKPKRIDLGHQLSVERTAKYVSALGLTHADRGMCAAQFDFIATKQRFIEVLSAGGSMVFWDRDQRDLVQTCRDERVTVLNANVIYLERVLAGLKPGETNVLAGLRVLRIGASTVAPQLRERIVRHLTPNIHVAYGMNEFGIVSLADPRESIACPEGVGKVVPNVRLEVVDGQGRVLPPGAVGSVRVRGPGMVDRYVGDDEASARAFRDGWFYPGDLATMTATGSVLLRGRADQMMILDGINIYPAEIEQLMLRHEAVADAVAVPLSSRIHQEIPVCAVALHAGRDATEGDLLAFAKKHLGVRMPRRVVILPRIPRNTAQGKIQRDELTRQIGEALNVEVRRESGA